MTIRVMPFLSRKGNRVASACVEFTDGPMRDFQLVGFTICDDKEKGLFVLFPSSVRPGTEKKPYFFLKPMSDDALGRLESEILDVYEAMTSFNSPRQRAVTK